jgi:hypothetical protein
MFKRPLLVINILAFSLSAHAALTQMNFQGSISQSEPFNDPTGNFSQGEPIGGFWLVETVTPDIDPSTGRGAYPQVGLPAFQIKTGSHVFQANAAIIQILDNDTSGTGTIDAYEVLATGKTSNTLGLTQLTMEISLRDTQILIPTFSSDALPSTAPNPADFDHAQGRLSGMYGSESFLLNLDLTRVSMGPVTTVPGPSAIWLLGSGLLGLRSLLRRFN